MARSKNSPEHLKIEDFKYLDSICSSPELILGLQFDKKNFSEYPPKKLRFKSGREWLNIAHQTAGMACHQHYFTGTILKPKPLTKLVMDRISGSWLNSNVGLGGITLTDANQYRNDLKTLLKVDCNNSWQSFEEALYPIDVEFLGDLTDEKFPKDLDDLIEWRDGFERACGCIGRWGIYILGKNCD